MRKVALAIAAVSLAAGLARAQCSVTTLNITIANGLTGPYVVNGVNRQTLVLAEGQSYTFNFPTGTGSVSSAHPFYITSDADGAVGAAAGQPTVVQLPGYTVGPHCSAACAAGNTFTITPGPLTPQPIYYNCGVHPNFGNSITVLRRPTIDSQPTPIVRCVGQSLWFGVTASIPTGGTPTYQWRHEGVDIEGATGSSIFKSVIGPGDFGNYDCVVSNICATTVTNSVSVTQGSCCPADLDNGSGTGVRDGGVDVSDLLFFLSKFEQGDIAVDLDNDGVDPALPDGGVDISDLLFFLTHFEGGC